MSFLETGAIDVFNPSINVSSQQVIPYNIYGGLNNIGNLTLGIAS